MKIGDLVTIKAPQIAICGHRLRCYAGKLGIIYSIAGKGIKVYMPDGTIKVGLTSQFSLVQSV